MKRIILALVLTAAVAGLALAQCPGHGSHGPMVERKEVMMRMDRGGCGGCGQPEQGMGCGPGAGQWWENPVVVKELGLSDKQSEQIDQLVLAHRKNVIKLEADLRIAEIEFRDLMEGNPSEAEVRKKAKAMSQLREKLHDLRIDHLLAVRRVLTAEQQKKLQEMRIGRRQHHRMMEGDCHGKPDAP